MPAPKKVELSYKLDSASSIAKWIGWYEEAKRTINPDSGRKRKGNARKALQDFLESLISEGGISTTAIDQKKFMETLKEYKEDTKLPPELQKAKNNLSPEEFSQFKSLFEKSERRQKRIGLLTDEFNFTRL